MLKFIIVLPIVYVLLASLMKAAGKDTPVMLNIIIIIIIIIKIKKMKISKLYLSSFLKYLT